MKTRKEMPFPVLYEWFSTVPGQRKRVQQFGHSVWTGVSQEDAERRFQKEFPHVKVLPKESSLPNSEIIPVLRRVGKRKRDQVYKCFLDGASMRRVSRKHSLPLAVVEEIVRERMQVDTNFTN